MTPTLAERDKQVIWHPFTPQKYAPDPIAISKGDGVYLSDISGKKYIDAISSWWVNLHGHAHPYIAEKIYQQALSLEQVIFAGFTHEPAVRLAERLINLLQGPFERVFYSDNGSTSTEVAIKMAIQYWWNRGLTKRNKILALKNAYHGDTFGAMSVSDRGIFTLAFQDRLFEVEFIDLPGAENLDQIQSNINWDEFACFIYEPLVQGAGGMKMYDAGSLDRLIKICNDKEVICIADEVMTGFGRTGKLFASQFCVNKPDIICLSKGITGGFLPLGVTACSDRIYRAFVDDDKSKTFYHGHSFTANPLACAAALASMDLLEKAECSDQRILIENKHAGFEQQLLQEKGPRFKNFRRQGTIIAFEWSGGEDSYLNSISASLTEQALQEGVYLRPLGNTIYLMPPYCIREEELDRVYNVILNFH